MPYRIAVALLILVAAPAFAGPPQTATEEEIAGWISAAGDRTDHPGADQVFLLDEADVHVQPSGLARTDSCRVVKVLTPAGAKSQAVLRLGYDPATNRAVFTRVRIHRASGGTVEVPLDRASEQPATQGSIFWGGTRLLLELPRLEAGDCLEIRESRIGFNIAYLAGDDPLSGEGLAPPMEGHWFEVTRFSGRHPVLRKRYSVHFPTGMEVQYEVHGGPLRTSRWRDEHGTVYTFSAEDIPTAKSEKGMVSRDDVLPKVVMATVPDWETKSRWFHEVNRDQFEADDAIRAKVAEITAGLVTDDEKIAACLHWVSDRIRYYGTSRGPCEGYTLHRGIETFHDRGGVCKDIAGMLITMLRVLEYEVHPALTMAGSRVEAIPADQFNHTVAALRRPDGSWLYLDPTWSPFSKELWSSREAEQGLVAGTPGGETLTHAPYFPPEANAARWKSLARIDDAGTLTATLRFTGTGYPCTYFRRNLERHPPAEREGVLAEALGIAPTLRLIESACSDPRDYSRDSTATFRVEAFGHAARDDRTMVFRLPLLRHPLGKWLIPDLLTVPPGGERSYPYKLRATRLLVLEETIALPEGYRVARLPKAVKIETGTAKIEFLPDGEGPELHYVLRVELRDHVVAPEDYADLRKVLEALGKLGDEWVSARSGKED